eukprot:2006284-Pyramimonas_sp.AAC.1
MPEANRHMSTVLSTTVRALDKEPLDKESRVWEPVKRQLRLCHGCRRRPHQARNPAGSAVSWAHS